MCNGRQQDSSKLTMEPRAEASDRDLLRGMIAGDERALTALYRRWQGRLYRFALQMTGNAGHAEEVTQETFITLIREAQSFDSSRGTLGSFLYGICRNHVRRYFEEESSYVGFPETSVEGSNGFVEPTAPSDLLEDLTAAQAVERVRAAVLTLPLKYREAIVLCDLHEMTYEQAAGVLGCALGTLRSRLHRARELLLAKLQRTQTEAASPASAVRRQAQGSGL
jgi:RNA polymerase sigma-70 factor, ECF subfamily